MFQSSQDFLGICLKKSQTNREGFKVSLLFTILSYNYEKYEKPNFIQIIFFNFYF